MNEKVFHVCATVTEDPIHSVTINYHSIDDSYIVLSKDDEEFNYDEKYIPNSKEWSTKGVINSSVNSSFQNIRKVCYLKVDKLKEDTKYKFRIISGSYKSKIYYFKTPKISNEFRFLSFADMQYGNNKLSPKFIKKMKEKFLDVSLMVSSGDLVDFGDKEEEWFNIIDNDALNGLTLAVAPGDHEYWGDDSIKYTQYDLPHTFLNILHFPKNGSKSSIGSNYYFIYNNVLFVILDMNDSNTTKGDRFNDQIDWFEKTMPTLKDQYEYLIVVEHKSLFGSKIEDRNVYLNLRPIFHKLFCKYNVDLVLSGHDHMYSRTYPINRNEEIDDNGIIYLDLGSSGDKVRHIDESLMDSVHEKVIDLKETKQAVSSLISIGSKELKIEVYNFDLNIVDKCIIKRKENR